MNRSSIIAAARDLATVLHSVALGFQRIADGLVDGDDDPEYLALRDELVAEIYATMHGVDLIAAVVLQSQGCKFSRRDTLPVAPPPPPPPHHSN